LIYCNSFKKLHRFKTMYFFGSKKIKGFVGGIVSGGNYSVQVEQQGC
jgi:hypothetical protein